MHCVYMRFELNQDAWRVTLTAGGAGWREFTFADRNEVEELAKCGGGLRTLAAQQALNLALRNGRGGVELRLSDEQLAKLER